MRSAFFLSAVLSYICVPDKNISMAISRYDYLILAPPSVFSIVYDAIFCRKYQIMPRRIDSEQQGKNHNLQLLYSYILWTGARHRVCQ